MASAMQTALIKQRRKALAQRQHQTAMLLLMQTQKHIKPARQSLVPQSTFLPGLILNWILLH